MGKVQGPGETLGVTQSGSERRASKGKKWAGRNGVWPTRGFKAKRKVIVYKQISDMGSSLGQEGRGYIGSKGERSLGSYPSSIRGGLMDRQMGSTGDYGASSSGGDSSLEMRSLAIAVLPTDVPAVRVEVPGVTLDGEIARGATGAT